MAQVRMTSRTMLPGMTFLFLAAPVQAQDAVTQTLDRVAVNSSDSVVEMEFANPLRTADFIDTGIRGADFRACRLTAIDGVFCLDGEVVRNWPDPQDPLQHTDIVDCRDPALGLDTRKPDTCSVLTVDSAGSVWVAGRTRTRAHSLIQVVGRTVNGNCPPGFAALTRTAHCAATAFANRPLLGDITPVEGDVAEQFDGLGAGILGLEDGSAAVFFPSRGAPVEIAAGKQRWGLRSKEELQSLTLLQAAGPAGGFINLLLAATGEGRVLAVDTSGGNAVEAFDIVADRGQAAVQCDFDSARYGIRSSARSGLVYVTDRQYCRVLALKLESGGSGGIRLVNATGADGEKLTLATAAGPAATHPPLGPSVAPGIVIDLVDCAGDCALVFGAGGRPAATLSGVVLASQESLMTLFQVRNIPDCRYIPDTCRSLLGVTNLVAAGIIVDPEGTGNPAAQLLNVTPLLPAEITNLFEQSGGLPDMLVSRQYRGQARHGFLFEAFFARTEDGVVFRDTFVGEFDVATLAGAELGCTLNLPPGSPLFGPNGTLEWDVVTTVSERYPTFSDPALGEDARHVDTLENHDCGSSRSLSTRWSLKPYNLEITPCSYNADPGAVWRTDGNCPVGGPETPDDAVLAKLLLQLYDDLRRALDQLACTDAEGAGAAPLSPASCSTLASQWSNGKDKLDKCWNAAQQPKTSAGSQNCQSFVTQLTGFSNTLSGITPAGPDPANRIGELKARTGTIFHVFEHRFEPSIPAGGFVEP